MKKYRLNDLTVFVYDNGKFFIDNGKNPSFEKTETETKEAENNKRPNFEINIEGDEAIFLGNDGFSFDGASCDKKSLSLVYTCEQKGLEVTVTLEEIENVIVQTNTVKNIGDKPILLTRFSSAYIDRLFHLPDKAWYEQDLTIHICHNKWQGEGQWREYTPSQLGIYPSNNFPWARESHRISSIGSWSTANFYPIAVIENKTAQKTYFMETEGAQSWQIKLTGYGGYIIPNLAVEATSCDENLGGWHYKLKPNEKYSAPRAFYGVTDGGFEAAAASLNEFKRADSTIKRSCPPLVFNDYMDCLWENQDPKLIIPLIKAAAAAGCEYFCIDGGWNTNKDGEGFGDWIPKKDYYAETTLKNLADLIIENGMIPGIWLELDACSDTAELYRTDKDSVIRRYERPAGRGSRYFYNFKNEHVRRYLTERVKYLYETGYRYFKNDYNQSTGMGCTNNYDGSSPAQGLLENTNAFYDFIDSLYLKFPGLIIENCGAGAMRCENKTLKRFTLQSTSDQTLYKNNPSIVMGMEAFMPPEKAGIWAYPYPSVYNDCYKATDEYINARADGKETAFNIVTGMMGVMYLSGRIDCCDEKNFALIKQGIDIYKDIRKYIPKSRPIYPTGKHVINTEEVASFGLLSDNRLMLSVWNMQKNDTDVKINLSKYISGDFKILRTYSHTKAPCSLNGGTLCVKLDGESAVWFEITF